MSCTLELSKRAARPFRSIHLLTTGIFRKVADALPDLRLRAFLKVIREFECHEEADDAKRYFMTATPINGVRRFSDVATHPFEFEANKQGTPAGAY